MKKYLSIGLSILSSIFLISCNKQIKNAKDGNTLIDIIEINDLHGYVNNANKSNGYDLSNISYYVNEKRNKDNNEVVLIANGDMFEGTAFSNMSLGLSTLNCMNQMDFDMMGIGNHEFSWGLDSILTYFDGNEANGEANFPLINGNVYQNSLRYGESNLDDNIKPYTIIDKGGIKVGILSYIGDVESSISSTKLIDFQIRASYSYFNHQILDDANELKELGADIIIFNIHGGDSKSIDNYEINDLVSSIKDDEGNYLIDAVINGHTHSKQSSIKTRGKNKLPMVQGGSYCDSFGEIILEVNKTTKKVINASSNVIYTDSLKKDNKEEKVFDEITLEYSKIKDIVEKTYCNNKSSVSRDTLGKLIAKELRIGTSSDISIMNTGGIRTTLPIGDVTYSKIYDIYPFENHIVCIKAKGKYINDWINNKASNYYMDYTKTFDSETIYKITTIDYVFNDERFFDIFKEYDFISESTNITPRDYLIDDLENRGTTDFNPNGEIKVTVKEFGKF